MKGSGGKWRYVEIFEDRHGHKRTYFSRTFHGQKYRWPLPDMVDPEFPRRYAEVLSRPFPPAIGDGVAPAGVDTGAPEKQPRLGFVYVALCGDKAKIGFTTNPAQRLKNLNTGSPIPITFAACVPASEREEHEAQRRFKHLHVRNEWFLVTDDLIAWVQEIGSRTSVSQPQVFRSQTVEKKNK